MHDGGAFQPPHCSVTLQGLQPDCSAESPRISETEARLAGRRVRRRSLRPRARLAARARRDPLRADLVRLLRRLPALLGLAGQGREHGAPRARPVLLQLLAARHGLRLRALPARAALPADPRPGVPAERLDRDSRLQRGGRDRRDDRRLLRERLPARQVRCRRRRRRVERQDVGADAGGARPQSVGRLHPLPLESRQACRDGRGHPALARRHLRVRRLRLGARAGCPRSSRGRLRRPARRRRRRPRGRPEQDRELAQPHAAGALLRRVPRDQGLGVDLRRRHLRLGLLLRVPAHRPAAHPRPVGEPALPRPPVDVRRRPRADELHPPRLARDVPVAGRLAHARARRGSASSASSSCAGRSRGCASRCTSAASCGASTRPPPR